MNVDDLEPEYLMESNDAGARRFDIWKGMFVQGGSLGGGEGESVYGGAFADEPHEMRHTMPGLLTMCGSMPMREKEAEEALWEADSNRSQFAITTKSRTEALGGRTILHWDRRHTIFGRVIEGMSVVHAINKLPILHEKGHRIDSDVVIADCGQLKTEEQLFQEAEEKRIAEGNVGGGIIKERPDYYGDVTHRVSCAELEAERRGETEAKLRERAATLRPTAEDEAIASAEVDCD